MTEMARLPFDGITAQLTPPWDSCPRGLLHLHLQNFLHWVMGCASLDA